MNTSPIFIAISVVVLGVIAVLMFLLGKSGRANRLTPPLASLAFGSIVAGICFGDNRIVGYSLLGVGVVLAVVDIFRRSRGK